jgi:hypothetical protein
MHVEQGSHGQDSMPGPGQPVRASAYRRGRIACRHVITHSGGSGSSGWRSGQEVRECQATQRSSSHADPPFIVDIVVANASMVWCRRSDVITVVANA